MCALVLCASVLVVVVFASVFRLTSIGVNVCRVMNVQMHAVYECHSCLPQPHGQHPSRNPDNAIPTIIEPWLALLSSAPAAAHPSILAHGRHIEC